MVAFLKCVFLLGLKWKVILYEDNLLRVFFDISLAAWPLLYESGHTYFYFRLAIEQSTLLFLCISEIASN